MELASVLGFLGAFYFCVLFSLIYVTEYVGIDHLTPHIWRIIGWLDVQHPAYVKMWY
jgi:hypothetical protein